MYMFKIADLIVHVKSVICFNFLQAVEVLWSPQDTNDTLSEDELLENYPLWRPI
jgi:uncharacterized membrane protein